ncbi:hypothetical protein IC575_022266 [Cucumis melo]
MGLTCKQGKLNGKQKREGTALGRRRSKKRRLTLQRSKESERRKPRHKDNRDNRRGQPI